jgi:hypothetical protein
MGVNHELNDMKEAQAQMSAESSQQTAILRSIMAGMERMQVANPVVQAQQPRASPSGQQQPPPQSFVAQQQPVEVPPSQPPFVCL